MGYSYKDEPAQLDFPIAWTGPYYVKVEYYGSEDDMIEEDAEDGSTSPEPQPEEKQKFHIQSAMKALHFLLLK